MKNRINKRIFLAIITGLIIIFPQITLSADRSLELLDRVRGYCDSRDLSILGISVDSNASDRYFILRLQDKPIEPENFEWIRLDPTGNQAVLISPRERTRYRCRNEVKTIDCPLETSYIEVLRHGTGPFFTSCYSIKQLR